MSSGLMSCVRENSPPLELELSAGAGPLSLPEGKSRSHGYQGAGATSTPIASPEQGATTDGNSSSAIVEQQQQKRRRFHPLRNLRRIFRRRTINSADSAAAATGGEVQGVGSCNTLPPPTSSASEKNLRSVAIAGGTSSAAAEAVSASSPASPLTHQQLHESYQTQSLPKSKSYGTHRDELLSVLLGKKRASKQTHCLEQPVTLLHAQPQSQTEAMYQTQRQHVGVAVFPDTIGMSRNSYFVEKRHHQRQMRSVGDSSQELDAEDSVAVGATDMSDSQRSLSEARLLDADADGGYTRETLSQSHDSVFSESATASSLSIVLKAELTDVLRKRRNRPDASDEDLGLPRSPVSPQRMTGAGQSRKTAGGQVRSVAQGHESSSLSLLSVNSTDGEDTSQSHRQHTSSKSISSAEHSSSVLLREQHNHHNEEDVDAVGSERQRLSHAAAKHKMAIRPVKKNGPTRHHRRTLETSIPEAKEEDLAKMSQKQAQNPSLRAVKNADLKTKTRSLPPGSALTATTTATATNTTNSNMRTKTIEQKNSTITNINSISSSSSSSERTTTTSHTTTHTTSSTSSSAQSFGLRALNFKAANTLLDARGESSTDGDDVPNGTADAGEHGFLRRLMQRNSKRSIARANDGFEDVDNSQNSAKKLQISTSCLEAATRDPVQLSSKSRSATSHEQNIQETRQIIKREIHNEGKHGLNAMVSNYGVHPQPPTAVKPKSGPAARQRYLPQELGATSSSATLTNSDTDVTNLLSRSSRGNDTFQSTSLVREQAQLKTETATTTSHFERKPRIVGLSAFQQKLSRSSDSMGQHSSSSNSLETSTDEPSPLYYEEKQRKTVEKARSFRNYQEERDVIAESASMHNNMPSLPDLSLSFRVPTSYYKQPQSPQSPLTMSPMSPMSPGAKCVSLGFEINDNKLLQARAESTGKLQQTKLSPQRNSALLVTSPGPANISQIEQNIDLIVKSPMVSLLRKSCTVGEQLSSEQQLSSVPQRPKVLELKQTTTIAIGSPGKETASPLTKSAKLSASPPTTPGKCNRRDSNNVEMQPEFMKIQLNRVDQARLHSKTNHLVLAKNVKSPSTPTERSQSSDDLSMRRLSNESTGSIQIVERSQKPVSATRTPPQPLSPQSISQTTGAALVKQQRAVSATSLRSSYVSSGSSSNGSNEVLVATATTVISPSTPPKMKRVDAVEHEKANANRLSLEERKRLFLSEEKTQAERKLTEMRYERKKSISEEIQRKPETITASSPSPPSSPETGNGNAVVLRKKSFASANGTSNSNSIANGSAIPTSHDDPTPELMKVFARRSLKVKDDDVVAIAQIAVANHKKITNGSQSIDSDKENHSNSEEKLDKLPTTQDPPKITQSHGHSNTQSHTQSSGNHRSTVADFRNLNNNLQPAQQKLANLPPIKVSNVRNNNSNKNNNNNSNNNNSSTNNSVKPANERYSLQLKSATATATIAAAAATVADATEAPGLPIERSATVGEFKGIHQRRAEWEQRVKEALK
ncbi:serine-rich adhesin for platelets isoform X2 [Drosophila grimshawi]|uniref:serine-rich adhesin for platelets isoform X2 n=1 Tax=Drosophila grimshawi TaxID=7222 RepID=UPI000C870435|nr:serine-rich adhesin for platelets isoform X2 [Drosophila grimshawi]